MKLPNSMVFVLFAALGLLVQLQTAHAVMTWSGSLDPVDPTSWDSSTIATIGTTANGSLMVDGEDNLRSQTASLGYASGVTGDVTIVGSGATWTNDAGLNVGVYGNGTLFVEAGASVDSGFGSLGNKSGSTGNVTVDGDNSTWTNTGYLHVGDLGNGTLTISEGGSVSNGSGWIGVWFGTNGQVTVSGSESSWTNIGELDIGLYGSGTLVIEEGAVVLVTQETYVAPLPTSTGTIAFGPGGGTLDTKSLCASPTQFTGTGTVNTRGLVSDVDLTFDSSASLAQTLWFENELDHQVAVNLDMTYSGDLGDLGAGYRSSGSLTLCDGVAVLSSDGCLGFMAGSTGTATVLGPGSTWTSTGDFDVGYYGGGRLAIVDGGTVNSNLSNIGYGSASVGAVVVAGTGSTWNSIDQIYVGRDGEGTLTIVNGGTVSAPSLLINDQSCLAIEVSGNSRLLLNGGSLDNDGTVRILAGPQAKPGATFSPISAGEWIGPGICQALGGTWNEVDREFTASSVIHASSSMQLVFSLTSIQRVLVDDIDTGWAVGASFLMPDEPTTLDFTATAVTGEALIDLNDRLDLGSVVRGCWEFAVAAGYDPGDPSYLSFAIDVGLYSPDDLQVWHHDGSEWTRYDALDFNYDGTYASFTVSNLGSSYAVTITLIPGDTNGDRYVDEIDAHAMAAHWGQTAGWIDGDFDGDGIVGPRDAAILAANWNRAITAGQIIDGKTDAATVPEPCLLFTLLTCTSILLARRSR
ncbi:MAG: hypothetical protein JW888_07345 [Pirellulales bacterium]|nr:hypothetical protein [Pirellulales bacterium]